MNQSAQQPDSAKERTSRIQLDYWKRPDLLQRIKLRLTAACLVLVAAFSAVSPVSWHSPGPVAESHSMWNADCETCHVPFHPIGKKDWLAHVPLLGNRIAHGGDAQCQRCHAGPPHHSGEDRGRSPGCALCHQEHGGKDASLVRMADRLCTECHLRLSTATDPDFADIVAEICACHQDETDRVRNGTASTRFVDNVSRFAPELHPEFKLLQAAEPQDPGQLKFNHALHMTLGLVKTDDSPFSEPSHPFTFGDFVSPEDRTRYGGQGRGDADLVQLDCGSCHRLDGTDFEIGPHLSPDLTAMPRRTAGAYMVPITYENQCRACHPLTFDLQSPADPQSPRLTVPHGLQPDEVRNFLWGAYANEYVTPTDRVPTTRRLLPGAEGNGEEDKVRAEIQGRVGAFEQFLYRDKVQEAERIVFRHKQTCGECHKYRPDGNSPIPREIIPPRVPEIWFQHAKFSHLAHRAVDCRTCHRGVYAYEAGGNRQPVRPSEAASDVLLPGIQTCIECHSPRRVFTAKPTGGARFDCTECHRYHNGDQPQAGVGSKTRGAAKSTSADSFLTGTR